MKKTYVISGICIIMIMLAGCNNSTNEIIESSNKPKNESDLLNKNEFPTKTPTEIPTKIPTESNSINKTDTPKDDENNTIEYSNQEINGYEFLDGIWTTDHKSKENILNEGGTYIIFNYIKNSESLFEISIVSVQSSFQKLAIIEFEYRISEDTIIFDYDDDGFNNQGKVSIKIHENYIGLENTTTTSSDWEIQSAKLYKNQSQSNESENSEESLVLNNYYIELIDYLEHNYRLDVPFDDHIFYTDSRYYEEQELVNLSPIMLSIFRNEIYARHGYIFKNKELKELFLAFTWYTPTYSVDQLDELQLNEYEKGNLSLVTEIESRN